MSSPQPGSNGGDGDGAASDEPSATGPRSRWLTQQENIWPVPVMDIRPFTLAMLSTSKDPQAAANAVSFGRDDGLGFVDQSTPSERAVQLDLRYQIDGYLADGPLFIPRQMEHKWAVFLHRGLMLFVRSWTRQVHLRVRAHVDDGALVLADARGAVIRPDEDDGFTAASVDFIIRSHVLGEVAPALLPPEIGDDIGQAELWSFSVYGNKEQFATSHRFTPAPPLGIVRSHSMLHIAIARGDLAAAQSQLDRGVPIDLVAQDGLTALHWALAAPDNEVMRWLVARGLPIDAPSLEGATTLMTAVQSNNLDKVTWLLDAGADPNARDHRGFTSLHRAAEMGHIDATRLLLAHGADPAVDAQGQTPLSLAHQRGHQEIIDLLTPPT